MHIQILCQFLYPYHIHIRFGYTIFLGLGFMWNDVTMQRSIFRDQGLWLRMSLWGFLFNANVDLLLLVLLFNHLISCSLLYWFSFFLCLHFGHLQVFKSVEPLVLILFLYVFASWSFASFSRAFNLQCSFSFFLCLISAHLGFSKELR
jgi:hypothetical protein